MCLKDGFCQVGSNGRHCKFCHFIQEVALKAIADLFSTDYGLFSVGVIAFTLFMGFWFSRFFKRKIAEDAARAEREAANRS